MKDYRVYHLSSKEKIEYYTAACFVCFALGMLFYNSIPISFAICPITILFERKYADYKCNQRRKQMLESFKDALYAISASVAGGHQLPEAVSDAARQSEMFNDLLAGELLYASKVYDETHGDIDELLTDLGERSGIDEIKLFANSCKICRKSGGDLENVCLKSAYLLIERIDYQNEAASVLSEKKLDTIILMAMPPLILFFLNMSSYDYIALLYETLEGRIIMTGCLLLMIMAAVWSLKIMKLDL